MYQNYVLVLYDLSVHDWTTLNLKFKRNQDRYINNYLNIAFTNNILCPSHIVSFSLRRRYMAEILPIRRQTLSNQSIYQSFSLLCSGIKIYVLEWGAGLLKSLTILCLPAIYFFVQHTAGSSCNGFNSCAAVMRRMQNYQGSWNLQFR